jgi:hypothetical protein
MRCIPEMKIPQSVIKYSPPVFTILLLLLLSHFPYAFFRRRMFSFLLMDPLDIW